jgi:hypothetical protein
MSRLLYHLSYPAVGTRQAALRTVVDCPSPLTESNRRPSPYHGDALPTELRGRKRSLMTASSAPPARHPRQQVSLHDRASSAAGASVLHCGVGEATTSPPGGLCGMGTNYPQIRLAKEVWSRPPGDLK